MFQVLKSLTLKLFIAPVKNDVFWCNKKPFDTTKRPLILILFQRFVILQVLKLILTDVQLYSCSFCLLKMMFFYTSKNVLTCQNDISTVADTICCLTLKLFIVPVKIQVFNVATNVLTHQTVSSFQEVTIWCLTLKLFIMPDRIDVFFIHQKMFRRVVTLKYNPRYKNCCLTLKLFIAPVKFQIFDASTNVFDASKSYKFYSWY